MAEIEISDGETKKEMDEGSGVEKIVGSWPTSGVNKPCQNGCLRSAHAHSYNRAKPPKLLR